MEPDSIARAADTLAQAWRGHTRIDALPGDCRPATAEEGFAIQQALNGRLGRETAGWKLAHSSPPAMARIGVTTPPPGRLFAQTVKNSPAVYGPHELHAPRLEPEFAFLLARDLMVGDGPCTEDQAAALMYAQLNMYRGRMPVFLLPVACGGLVRQLYAWGARNCEMHVAQVHGQAQPPRGVLLPTFLPETG